MPHASIIQIIPAHPSQTSGVKDFAIAVAKALRREGRHSRFLVCNHAAGYTGAVEGFCIATAQPARASLLSALAAMSAEGPEVLILQLSPYGYSSSGAPFWLARALTAWKSERMGRRIVVYFHELYATGGPWTRAFWLSPFQRRCVRAFARLADAAYTNTSSYAWWLAGWKRRGATIMPVVSGLGEPDEVASVEARENTLVVLGSQGIRSRAYAAMELLSDACRSLRVDNVIDVGPGHCPGLDRVPVKQRTRRGVVTADEAQAILQSSRFGYVDYFPGLLGKSSVFAAYCANGLVPVLPRPAESQGDGLLAGKHYWFPGRPADVSELSGIAVAAREWYRAHDSAAHARALVRTMAEIRS
jgi:hypothetical protein